MKKNLSGRNYIDLGLGGLLTGFSGMAYGGYEERKVARYGNDGDGLIIDTAFTNDTGYFETGVIDERYDNNWIIVEEYKDKHTAEKGHNKWVKLLKSKKVPKYLTDVHGAGKYKLIK